MKEPNLRFKDENGNSYPSWVEIPLGELVTDNLDPVPTPREGYRRVGIYCHAKGTFQEDVPAEDILDVDTMYRIHKDNLIVNITFAWEHAVAIVKPEDEGLLVSHRFPEYSFNVGQVPGFYKYLILRPYFKNKLSLASPGGAGRNRVLNKAQFKEIIVTVPCEEEQKKIANFFSSVDEVIVAGEREVANLETQKKTVMKKIFSQEVRFKREDGTDFPEWEEKNIDDLGEIIGGGTPKTSVEEYWNGDTPWISSADLEENNIHVVNITRYITKDAIDNSATKRVPKDAILIISRVGVGKVAVSPCELCTSQDYMSVVPCTGNIVFLGYAISKLMQDKSANVQGTSIKGIPSDEIKAYSIGIPCLEEQRLIADFLSNFDEAISAAKKELALWKELKKGLLQQMFV